MIALRFFSSRIFKSHRSTEKGEVKPNRPANCLIASHQEPSMEYTIVRCSRRLAIFIPRSKSQLKIIIIEASLSKVQAGMRRSCNCEKSFSARTFLLTTAPLHTSPPHFPHFNNNKRPMTTTAVAHIHTAARYGLRISLADDMHLRVASAFPLLQTQGFILAAHPSV